MITPTAEAANDFVVISRIYGTSSAATEVRRYNNQDPFDDDDFADREEYSRKEESFTMSGGSIGTRDFFAAYTQRSEATM